MSSDEMVCDADPAKQVVELSADLAKRRRDLIDDAVESAKLHLPPSNEKPTAVLVEVVVQATATNALRFESALVRLVKVEDDGRLRVSLIDSNHFAVVRSEFDASPVSADSDKSRRSSRSRSRQKSNSADGSFLVDQREVVDVHICPRDVDNDTFQKETLALYTVTPNSGQMSHKCDFDTIQFVYELGERDLEQIQLVPYSAQKINCVWESTESIYIYRCSWPGWTNPGDQTWEVLADGFNFNLGNLDFLIKLLRKAHAVSDMGSDSATATSGSTSNDVAPTSNSSSSDEMVCDADPANQVVELSADLAKRRRDLIDDAGNDVALPSESISTCTDAGAQLGQEGSAMPLSEGDCDQSNKKRKADGHLSFVGLGLTGKDVHPWPNLTETHTGKSNRALVREILQSIALARNKSDEPLHTPDSDVSLVSTYMCVCHLSHALTSPICVQQNLEIPYGSGSRSARFYMEYEEEDARVRSGSSDLSISVLNHFIVRGVPRSGSHWANVGGMFALRMLVVLESQKAGVPLEKDAILHYFKKAFPTTVGKLEFYRIMVSLDPLFPGRYFPWWWIFHPEEYSKTPHERCSESRATRTTTPILPPYSANEATFFSDSVGSVHGGFRSSYTFREKFPNTERLEWYSPTFRTKIEAAIWSKIARTQFVLLIGAMSTPLVGKSGIMGFLNECSIYALRVVIRKYGSYLED
ncbi:hypothetical protein THAOC_12456 [Thalassiosira oceanica]|uniref:Uncharacterized protein n=1 Tax=Thalassiosira oceanica TaxID=159749 RepID=K0T828_THAOC|nr:hypothetical protein THAOC_12456 [Thalassiosira oceanica]|eukprot:EJK66612.1 hypothetical protein THAOC_12456 [Thalassiosira oceanica]